MSIPSSSNFETGEKSGTAFLYSMPSIPALSNIDFNSASGGGYSVHFDSPRRSAFLNSTSLFFSPGVCFNLSSYELLNSVCFKAVCEYSALCTQIPRSPTK